MDSTTVCMCEGFSKPPDHKTGSFQSHPQSTEENELHFMCLACGSLQGLQVDNFV